MTNGWQACGDTHSFEAIERVSSVSKGLVHFPSAPAITLHLLYLSTSKTVTLSFLRQKCIFIAALEQIGFSIIPKKK